MPTACEPVKVMPSIPSCAIAHSKRAVDVEAVCLAQPGNNTFDGGGEVRVQRLRWRKHGRIGQLEIAHCHPTKTHTHTLPITMMVLPSMMVVHTKPCC